MLMMVSVGAWAQKITSVSGITSGHKYYIGATTDGTDYYFSTNCSAPNSSVLGTAVTSKSEATVIQFIKDNNSGKWNLKFDGTDNYLAFDYNQSDGTLNIVSTQNCLFSIEEISSLLRISKSQSLLKEKNGSRFGAFDYGTTKAVGTWLEAIPTTATISINPACTDGSKVYGTYSNTAAWVVPENLTVSAITVSSGALTMADYATGEVVPANAGVLVSASAGGNYSINLSSEAGSSKTGNALRSTGNGITAEQMAAADTNSEFFRLTMHNGNQIGFWWGAENGAAFALGANKAYLAVANDNLGARTGLWFGDNEEALEAIEIDAATTIYTLDGVKVNELQKGLNIVNGKKIFVK